MGKVTTPKYRIEYWDNDTKGCRDHADGSKRICWNVTSFQPGADGKPTEKNLAKKIESMNKSFQSGGVNFHLSKAVGFIVSIHRAQIVNQFTGEVVAKWNAPAFACF